MPTSQVVLSPAAREIIGGYRGFGAPRWSRELPGREADLVDLPADLPRSLHEALVRANRSRLYLHQLETLNQVRAGKNVLLVTSTASGKTLAFNTAILDSLLQEPGARALYLYPLNALANDQRQALLDFVALLPADQRPRVGLVTGQATDEEKRAARDAHLILTNPETVHYSLLQRPTNWAAALSRLRFIVVDEAHMYRGAFGAHMAHVLGRLLRLAQGEGARPQIIAASATIGNPAELGRMLTGRDFTVIDRDGSAKPGRELIAWEPPVFDDGSYGSYEAEAVALTVASLRAGRSVILFARSRRSVESLTSEVKDFIGDADLAEAVVPYRGGYTAGERREIEDGLRSGSVRAVITTNALEAGIDIGSLDVAILAGYPGTMMAFWQQAGRAGRRGRSSQIFYIPSANPLDAYFAADPERLLTTPHELATFDPWNPRIAVNHVLWRAIEMPIRASGPWESDMARRIVERLADEGLLQQRGSSLAASRPHDYGVSLRSIEGMPYPIVDGRGNRVGEIDEQYLYRECHPGAIYTHRGRAYRVLELDDERRQVLVSGPEEWTKVTRVVTDSSIEEVEVLAQREIGPERSRWRVRLTRIVVHETYPEFIEYNRKGRRDEQVTEIVPPLERHRPTIALRIELPSIGDTAAHAVEHALLGMVPTAVMCDRRDFIGLTEGTDACTVTLYDRNVEGLGFAERAFERVLEIAAAAADRVGECPCHDGCPLCVQAPTCERFNDRLYKHGASLALDAVLGIERRRQASAPRAQPERRDGAQGPVPVAPSTAERARSVTDALVAEQRAAAIQAMEDRRKASDAGWRSDIGLTKADFGRGTVVRHPAFGEGRVEGMFSNMDGLSIVAIFGGDRRTVIAGEGNLAVRKQ